MQHDELTGLIATVMLLAVLIVLVSYDIYVSLVEWFENRAYERDFKRAAVIAQHQLLTMPAKKAGAR
jgi:hypothetical protein